MLLSKKEKATWKDDTLSSNRMKQNMSGYLLESFFFFLKPTREINTFYLTDRFYFVGFKKNADHFLTCNTFKKKKYEWSQSLPKAHRLFSLNINGLETKVTNCGTFARETFAHS